MSRPVAAGSRWVLWLLGLVVAVPAVPVRAGDAATEEAATFFETKIRPTLAGTCFPCHGGKKTSAGLRVDSRAALIKGGESGRAIVPGDPDASLLIQAVRHTSGDLKMPPGGRTLGAAEVADLAAWVRNGASWPSQATAASGFSAQRPWAFEPVRQAEPPDDPSGWSASPIDRFVAHRWRTGGLHPVEQADRPTLIRRLSFDLTGLPPTPDETAGFLGDGEPDAYEKLVDRLLASPRYGERWGRHWLDVARYADTAGDNADYPVPELALYRNYVIDAFNADKPYDAFVREQLAGDLIAADGPRDHYAESVVATGFLALSRRYATAPYELWHLSLEDTIDTTGRAFLGMTLRCARCHDHKFDPVPQTDYYALYGVFASTAFPYAGSEEFQSMNRPRERFAPLLPPDLARPKLDKYADAVRTLEDRLKAEEGFLKSGDAERVRSAQKAVNTLKTELVNLKRPGLPRGLPGAYAVCEGKAADVPLQRKGDPGQPGPIVPRGAPTFLTKTGHPPPVIPPNSSGRLELARWLTRPDHPLTARVMVNRVWQHHFGQGIVATPSNFGLRGEVPTHPELLDWLAARFVADGWSIKVLHRRIVTSKTYRLSSRHDAVNAAKDPANRFLWRAERRRLGAESLRDAMLAVSGGLDTSRPGSHPFPPIDQWHWTQHSAFKDVYATNHRTVYMMTQRLQRHPYLALFDGSDTNASTDVRTHATVPLQALYLMNNPFVSERAEQFAVRLTADAPDPSARIARAIALAWNRMPAPDEVKLFRSYLETFADESARAGASSEESDRLAWVSVARLLLTANEFFYVD
jgi:mono/diheme cytochrome c family protein